MEKWPPDRRELGDADNLDGPEQRRRVIQPRKPRGDQIGGPHHRRRQRRRHRILEAGDRSEAWMLTGPGLKVEAGPPRLAQRVGAGAHHARQRLDPVQLADIRLRQDGYDGFPEGIVVHRLRQSAREPCRELLEGHDLEPVLPVPGRIQPQLPHPEPAMGDDRTARRFLDIHVTCPGDRSIVTRAPPVARRTIDVQVRTSTIISPGIRSTPGG